MALNFRLFDFEKDNVEELFDLYRVVYKGSTAYEKRWRWEYEQNPLKDQFKIFIAKDGDKLVGATTRWPFKLKINDKIYHSAFNVNSMIHPDYRRQGIIETLYKTAMDHYDFVYSKGTIPAMYRALMKMGFQPIPSNSYMTCILSNLKWALWRLEWYKTKIDIENISFKDFLGFEKIDKFDEKFDRFRDRVIDQYSVILDKDSIYMNWRYINNPLKSYKAFYRKKNSKIISMGVVSQNGTTAKLVDLIWDKTFKDEPCTTIKTVIKECKKAGFLKLVCWSSLKEFKEALKSNSFRIRKDVQTFCIYTDNLNFKSLIDESTSCFFVDGDGDTEYLFG